MQRSSCMRCSLPAEHPVFCVTLARIIAYAEWLENPMIFAVQPLADGQLILMPVSLQVSQFSTLAVLRKCHRHLLIQFKTRIDCVSWPTWTQDNHRIVSDEKQLNARTRRSNAHLFLDSTWVQKYMTTVTWDCCINTCTVNSCLKYNLHLKTVLMYFCSILVATWKISGNVRFIYPCLIALFLLNFSGFREISNSSCRRRKILRYKHYSHFKVEALKF